MTNKIMDKYPLNKNGEGYIDPTAHKAIKNASKTEKHKVRFVIPGEPVAKERPRRDKRTGRFYTPSKTQNFETVCSLCYGNKHYFDGNQLRVSILFKFEIPKGYSKKNKEKALMGEIRPSKKDLDNCIKAVLDGLNGKAWKDDRYIHELSAKKIFSDKSEIVVEIEEI